MPPKASKTVAPYGFWKSPITTDLLLQKNTPLLQVLVPSNADSGADVAWIEMTESGRSALMHTTTLSSDDATEVSAGEYNARSGVHEYGGGSAASLADGSFLFTDYKSKSLFRAPQGGHPEVVTDENAALRYADFGPHPSNKDLVLAIQEDHTEDTPSTVVNSIVLLDLSEKTAKVHRLLNGKKADEQTDEAGPQKRDFYTFARFSPDGRYVCWVSWNHPSMPWWDTQLWVARIDLSDASAPQLVSPTQIKVASSQVGKQQVMQSPVWAIPSNPKDDAAKLFFTCDATDYLNLYSTTISSSGASSPEPVLPEPVKHDFSGPAWTCDNSDYIPLSPDLLVVSYSHGAGKALGLINLRRPRLIPLKTPFVGCSQLRRLTSTSFALLASYATEPTALVCVDLRNLAAQNYALQPHNITVVKRSSSVIFDGVIDQSYLSEAREIDFPTTLANGEKAVAHAVIYEPKSGEYVGEKGRAPPCVFTIHGGPTASAGMGFSLQTQFWTSRGFMVCSVNYGGSTGYGREFMERLTGLWGVTDVNDTVAAAKFLGSKASLEPRRFSSLSAEEQEKVRRMLDEDAEESGAAEISDGGRKVVLHNTTRAWGWMDLVLAGASLGVAYLSAIHLPGIWSRYMLSYLPALLQPSKRVVQAGAVLASFSPYALSKSSRIHSESATILPGLGVQLATVRSRSTTTRLIPEDRVLDMHIGEGYRYFSVVDTLLLSTTTSSRGREGAGIQRLFPNLVPRLSTSLKIYRALAPHLGTNSEKHRSDRTSLADPNALLISGGSAGGYTVLACLCFHPHVFSGGLSRYGVSSLRLLAEESHKFESQYPFQLIGGTPESHPQVYHDRSPIYYASHIKAPILLLQGSDDKVVPKSQADEFVKELKKGGGQEGKDWRYKVYQGEGHGFRIGENIKDSIEEELNWWQTRCLEH